MGIPHMGNPLLKIKTAQLKIKNCSIKKMGLPLLKIKDCPIKNLGYI